MAFYNRRQICTKEYDSEVALREFPQAGEDEGKNRTSPYVESHGTKGGFMEIKNYQIKIYRHYDNGVRKVAECSVNFTTKITYYMYDLERNLSAGYVIRTKIVNCKCVEKDQMVNDVREVIEVTLENELNKHKGINEILDQYKPPVGGSIVQINGVDYSWTIEEVPL